jgi:hypothetical protein
MAQAIQKRRRAVAALTAVLVAAAFLVLASMAVMRSMSATPVTLAELARAPAKPVDVPLEITSAGDGRYAGRFLERAAKAEYLRSARTLSFTLDDRAKFVMGAVSDLRPGAVVLARGRVRDGTLFDIDRVVVLTGYVHLR